MIHKEGINLIKNSIIILLSLNVVLYYFATELHLLKFLFLLISLILISLIIHFFRNPKIKTIINDNNVIAPADGKIVVIEEVFEYEYFKDQRIQISIFMSPLDVHVNRNPISGIVKFTKYHPGKFLIAWHPKSSYENERTTIVIENKKIGTILIRQIAGALARRIIMYSKKNEKVIQGEDLGFIKFGSRVDLFLPLESKINVKLHEHVKGGQTIISSFE